MRKVFNTTGTCYPDEHYMVNLETRLAAIKNLIDNHKYFVINRARQYGKTTILHALKGYLSKEYRVVFLDFQRMSSASFQNEFTFTKAFIKEFLRATKSWLPLQDTELNQSVSNPSESMDLPTLFEYLNTICAISDKPLILMIDEVDSASNNQIFLDFLAQLRNCYLERKETPTFQSVILAGVYDIKNLKLKIRPDEEHHRYNSPWNIAADFDVNLSFSVDDIIGILKEYENDHKTGMNITSLSREIHDYTNGYPYLVSYICKIMDENYLHNQNAWTREGIGDAIKKLMKESNTLFYSGSVVKTQI